MVFARKIELELSRSSSSLDRDDDISLVLEIQELISLLTRYSPSYHLSLGGNVDCSAVQPSQPCFKPDTLLSHASFAFNSYYQQNEATDVACSFGGNGVKVDKDPSYDNCLYMTAGVGMNKTASSNTTAMTSHSSSSSTQNEAFALTSSFVLKSFLLVILLNMGESMKS
ncbi:hypothetical protein Q3G72_009942 [Acer saccharum]|nr:hypothetical protein Q3G72_009942 [Acer saccharum]